MFRSLINIVNFVSVFKFHFDQPTITLPSGTYKGTHLPPSPSIPHSQDLFLGIPYAQPPLGSLRFRPPRPVIPSNETHDATAYSVSCVQSGPFSAGLQIGEDCLTLNVVRPSRYELDKLNVKKSGLPVLVSPCYELR